MTAPTPDGLESQRLAALSACTAMRTALRCGQILTVETKLMLVEVYLNAMAKETVDV